MVVAFFVVAREFLAGGFEHDVFCNVTTQRDGELEVAKRGAGVTAGKFGEVVESLGGDGAGRILLLAFFCCLR